MQGFQVSLTPTLTTQQKKYLADTSKSDGAM